MAYQALYRQWRPQTFADFVGQEAVLTTLRNQVQSGRIAHAYLFCGSRGTGKTSAAKVFARAINCQNPQAGDLCGKCEACQRLAEENNLDIVEIDAASNNGVDEIRDLREKVKYPPQAGRYRVYIIDEVHMLSAGAFNALLKTLEEPPAHAVFILATTEPQKLPATVLSRCQRYDFRRFPAAQITGRLREAVERAGGRAEPAALERIARAAEGGMRDALSILDMCLSYGRDVLDEALVLEVLGASDRAFLFRFSRALVQGDAAAALAAIDELMRGGREAQVFARDVTQHLRALMLAQQCGDALADLLEMTTEDAKLYQQQAAEVPPARLLRMLDLFLAAEADMKWANQPRVALEVAAVRACSEEGPSAAVAGESGGAGAIADDAVLRALRQRLEKVEQQLAQAVRCGTISAPAEPQTALAAQPAAQPEPKAFESTKATALSQPQAPAGPLPSSASGQAVWNKAMDALKRQQPAAFAQLRNTRFGGCVGHVYQVLFAANMKVMMQSLDKDIWRAPIEAALRGAGDPQATLRFMLEGETGAAQQAAQAQKQQEEIFDLFGREFVQVVDE